MAANCIRTTISRCSRSTVSPFTAKASSKLSGLASEVPASGPRLSLDRRTLSRIPVELGGALSMMPLHSVTASSRLTSLLSLNKIRWGCLSEGFATPL